MASLNSQKNKKAITLVELLIAIFLLGAVVLTGISIELAMRNMTTKPSEKVKLMDELIPVVNKIKKDFDRSIGNLDNASVDIATLNPDGFNAVYIRVDDGDPNKMGQLDPADKWYVYRWNGTAGDPVEYFCNSTTYFGHIALGIRNFEVSTPPGKNINEALKIHIEKTVNSGQPANAIDNPGANITTTIYSRSSSLN